jgi:hypothetical protein
MPNFYVDDDMFGGIITKYFNEQYGWREGTFFPDLHHSINNKCNLCNITNDFSNLDQLSIKGELYKVIKSTNYLPKHFQLDMNNLEFFKPMFNNTHWVIKPEQSYQHKGLMITNKFSQMVNHLRSNTEHESWVCQEYIKKPLLYYEKKWHLRVYVLILRKNNVFEAYLYHKGYMYVAYNKFKFDDFSNQDIHITASCNNKEIPTEFDKYYGKGTFDGVVKPQLEHIVRDTLQKTFKKFTCPNWIKTDYMCYKFLGYDIILDENFKAYLMEINAKLVGMDSTDVDNHCKNEKTSLQTMEFKSELMTELLDIILKRGPLTNFKLVFSDLYEQIESFAYTEIRTIQKNFEGLMVTLSVIFIILIMHWFK